MGELAPSSAGYVALRQPLRLPGRRLPVSPRTKTTGFGAFGSWFNGALTTVCALAALLVLVPVAHLAWLAAGGGTDTISDLAQAVLPVAVRDTTLLLLGVGLVAGVIGTGTAWLVTAYRFPGSGVLSWLLPLPLAVPTYVAAFVFVELLDAAGPLQSSIRATVGWQLRSEYWFPEVRSLPGCVVVMALVLYPYVFVPARVAFRARGRSAIDAARTLGASGWRVFGRLALPGARPAIAAGITLVLLETMADIGASEFLGVRTLTLSAYTAWLNRSDLPAAAQLACLALVVVVVLLAIDWRLRATLREGRQPSLLREAEPERLGGWRGAAALAACLIPVLLGLAVPIGFLVGEGWRRSLLGSVDADFVRHLAATVGLATAATALVLAVALPVALASRFGPRRLHAVLGGIAGLGYALPGTVLVLGLLAPLVAVDGAVSAVLAFATGSGPKLILTGSVGGLMVAYVVRFLRVATAPVAARLEMAGSSLESAARVLGARPAAVARHVHLPLLGPALAAAALMVLLDCFKELPATLLLRPLNFDTMATLVYASAARGSFEDGALAALAIVALCLGPVVWLTRATRPSFAAEAIAPPPPQPTQASAVV